MEEEKKPSFIFSELDIKLINEKVIDNMKVLRRNRQYNDLEDEFRELEIHLLDYFDESQRRILNKYTRYNSEITNYYIALGYYLGMKAMREIEKLK